MAEQEEKRAKTDFKKVAINYVTSFCDGVRESRSLRVLVPAEMIPTDCPDIEVCTLTLDGSAPLTMNREEFTGLCAEKKLLPLFRSSKNNTVEWRDTRMMMHCFDHDDSPEAKEGEEEDDPREYEDENEGFCDCFVPRGMIEAPADCKAPLDHILSVTVRYI